jgi:hypothetical protein
MDKLSMQLALASAKASGDGETVRMIMSANRDGRQDPKQAKADPVSETASEKEPSAAKLGALFGQPFDMKAVQALDKNGEPREMGDEERAHVAEMLQKILGGMLSSDEGSDSEDSGMETMARSFSEQGPRMLVIDGSTGEVVGGEGVPPEVLEAIKSFGMARIEQMQAEEGNEGEGDDEGDDEDLFSFEPPSGKPPTRH